MEKRITVDTSKCIHCGMCIRDCGFMCLEFDEAKVPRYTATAKTIALDVSIAWPFAPKVPCPSGI